jgi:UDPglucose--hexose-1-phosphate uridylyltransferase
MVIATGGTELRKDPISNQWVLVRNWAPRSAGNGPCPLCPGHEAQTPPEIAAYRTNGQPANSSEWLVRVIPDFAPLLQIEGDVLREGVGIFDRVSARGASEIVIESPDHAAMWDTLRGEDIERVLRMYQERVEDLYRDPRIRAILILRREDTPNAQVSHPFSRILGAPILFDDLRRELTAARQYFARKQRCLSCDILQQEGRDGIRVIEESRRFLVYAPYGSRRPFETWVVPRTHHHRFEAISPLETAALARSLQGAFRRLHAVQPGVPLEVTLHTAPNEALRLRDAEWRTLPEDYHWHMEIVPGCPDREIVGGFAVNPIPPEAAAARLRDAV